MDELDEQGLYHDERARLKFQLADRTYDPVVAERHRDLARLHIARRGWSDFVTKIATGEEHKAPPPIYRTDKEA